MTLDEIKKEIKSEKYDFLRNDKRFSDMLLLVISGSHSYGTNTPKSDIDIRGIAFNTKEDILLMKDFKVYKDPNTDTTIYSFNRAIEMLINGSPSVLEIFGVRNKEVIKDNFDISLYMARNMEMFLSKNKLRDVAINMIKNARKTLSVEYHDKLAKEQLHSVRTAFLITKLLRYSSIFTYDRDNIRLFKDIRDGKYIDNKSEFEDLLNFMEENLDAAYKLSDIQPEVDMNKVNKFIIEVNERIVNGKLYNKIGVM